MSDKEPRECDENWYDAFYIATAKSSAYSEYCEKLFGYDFTQQGFSDKFSTRYLYIATKPK